MNRPLLVITICFITGIVLNAAWGFVPGVLLLLALVCMVVVLAGCIFNRWDNRWFIILLFIVLGWFVAGLDSIQRPDGPERFAGHFVSVDGMVAREPDVRKNYTAYIVAAEAVWLGDKRVDAGGLVLVRIYGGGSSCNYGDYLRVKGFLYRPGEPGNFGAFNYRNYLARRGIYCLMNVDKPDSVQILGTGGNPLVRLALQGKQRLTGVASLTLNEGQAAVLAGMLFGNTGGIDQSVKDVFSQTGVAHVLSVSGLHVGFVLAGVLLLATALGLPRRVVPALALGVLVFYAVMTGMGPAVQRAGIMGLLVLMAVYLGRERDWPSTLALAALVILLFDPSALYEIGFQLSFTATWGILYLMPKISAFLVKGWGWPRWLALPLGVTIAAQLATLPLLIYYFNLVTPVAPLANLLLVPLVGLIMLLGFLGSACGIVFLPAAAIINAGTGVLIDFFTGLARLISLLPGGYSHVATPPWYAVAFWYAGLVGITELIGGRLVMPPNLPAPLCWLGTHNRRIRMASVGLAVFLLLVIFWPWGGVGGRLQVHFIDVGQGDSILVRFPGGRTMLVDAGGRMGDPEDSRGVGETIVVPYLHRLGMDKLDVLAVTHPHGDHAGGVPPVAEKLSVGALVLSGAPGYEALLKIVSPLNIPVYRVGAGHALHIDKDVEVTVLAPARELSAASEEELNDASLVLRLEYGQVSFLLTGDIEEEAQRDLLGSGARLQADVLKVPHHGSRFFEPEFFEAVAPGYAVIQVGKNNRFGHPAPETLEALNSTGAVIFRNDRDGAVLFTTDGWDIEVQTAR
ncbi:DNA internalization-related competence protein ComEC/Rec2 [Desulfallas thermosapovorans]|uniref:Competence protein ComEC n=1 Tax=Desulfallas thermosapovorans DSM 6562 TaxID=1121431 RepID=A0A5S4ZYJ8_9FIRM|nr:DNA internalization-related competence protein ComEC/Rec2 [Desulfallas thermosapovorans]TYO97221.1 competence protein ComEC [Desulfallas thermosapovorans DSM 6562]